MIKANSIFKQTFIFVCTFILCFHCSKKESTFTHNTLSQSEINEGWSLLFDGKSLEEWTMIKENGWTIENDALSLAEGRNIWTKKCYGDFILDCEFRMSPQCNSGIFLRTDNIEDYVQTGIEMQVTNSYGKSEIHANDCGAIFDCLTPSANDVKQIGEWNHVIITCDDNIIKVILNEVPIIDMDLDKWTEPHMNPDGSKNKYHTALKDFIRNGHIGFQDHGDHGHPVWYRNIKIKEL